jgi:hypothetical protein
MHLKCSSTLLKVSAICIYAHEPKQHSPTPYFHDLSMYNTPKIIDEATTLESLSRKQMDFLLVVERATLAANEPLNSSVHKAWC